MDVVAPVPTADATAVLNGFVAGPLAIDSRAIFQTGPLGRAAVALTAVLLIGGVVLAWDRSRVERATVSSTNRPLYSLAHGVAAHVVIIFGAVYAANQLGPIEIAGRSAASVGMLAGIVLLLVVAAFGFTVVGTIIVEYGLSRGSWTGLVAGAVLAAVAASLPLLYGGLLWLLLVSMGIGGPLRLWFNASSDGEI